MNILPSRIHNQLLGDHHYKNPVEVVKHLLCLQSQDFKQAKRAIASRCHCTQQDIEDAFNSGQIVRTRTQRGTIHTVAAEDVGRMTTLCASKTLGGFKKRREYLGIADTQMHDILATLPIILADGPMSRTNIAKELQLRGFDMTANKPYHIMCYAGTLGITVQGPIVDGEHAFVVASEWISSPKILTEEESLIEIVQRYFSSHGPATIADLQWWSGLGVGMLRKGIALCGGGLIGEDGIYTFTNPPPQAVPLPYQGGKDSFSSVHFLAGFDEFLLGYKDRTATLDFEHHILVDKARNGIFKPTIMKDGKTIGIWTVKHKKNSCEITVTPFEQRDLSREKLKEGIKAYENYIAKEIILILK